MFPLVRLGVRAIPNGTADGFSSSEMKGADRVLMTHRGLPGHAASRTRQSKLNNLMV